MEKISDDPLTFQNSYDLWLFSAGLVLLFALANAGVGYIGYIDLLSEGGSASNVARILFSLFYVAILAVLYLKHRSAIQRRVVIRDGIVHCYLKRTRSSPWTLDESLHGSEFNEIQIGRSWGAEHDFFKWAELKGPSHSVCFFHTFGGGDEDESYLSKSELGMIDKVAGELGGLPIHVNHDSLLRDHKGMMFVMLIIFDLIGLIYFYVIYFYST